MEGGDNHQENTVSNAPIGTTSTSALSGTHHVGQHGSSARRTAMDAAAQALGMSSSDLRSSLRSGQTLASLATSKGATADAVTTAIATALTTADPTMSASRASAIADRMMKGPQQSGHVDRDNDGD